MRLLRRAGRFLELVVAALVAHAVVAGVEAHADRRRARLFLDAQAAQDQLCPYCRAEPRRPRGHSGAHRIRPG